MKLDALLVQTESWAQEELAAQTRYYELLEAQIDAVRTSDSESLAATAEEMDVEVGRRGQRDRRRQTLLKGFGDAFGVDPGTLTLSSIVERARATGLNASRLEAARGRIRDAASRSLRAGRKLSLMVRYHQGVFQELLTMITPEESAGVEGADGGSWVHVEA